MHGYSIEHEGCGHKVHYDFSETLTKEELEKLIKGDCYMCLLRKVKEDLTDV